MKKTLLTVAALCVLASGSAMAYDQDGKWQVRARILNMDNANKGPAGHFGVSASNKTFPEFDISYFFTPNFAAELVLTYPQKHDIKLDGTKLGTLKQLPPTLLAQYHFTDLGAFKPYVGAGLNYTRFSNVKWNEAGQPLDLTVKKSSWGGALQVGFDYALDQNWSLNFDVKKVYIDTKVNARALGADGDLGKLKINPVLISVGVGYRF